MQDTQDTKKSGMTMETYVGLFRGINVGGSNKLPMQELRQLLEEKGYTAVQTYIQSGNVVFRHAAADPDALAQEISAAVMARVGFQPAVMLLDAQTLQAAAAANPFPHGEADPKSLHLYFLGSTPQSPDLDALHSLKTETEAFDLIGAVFYLHAPDGIGRSKVAAQVEKRLGVKATARNWRTVGKLLEMVQATH